MPFGHHSKSWKLTNGGVKPMKYGSIVEPQSLQNEIKESFTPKIEKIEKKKSKYQKQK